MSVQVIGRRFSFHFGDNAVYELHFWTTRTSTSP